MRPSVALIKALLSAFFVQIQGKPGAKPSRRRLQALPCWIELEILRLLVRNRYPVRSSILESLFRIELTGSRICRDIRLKIPPTDVEWILPMLR